MNNEQNINETEVSADIVAKTRMHAARIEGEILRQLASVTQAHAATCIGVHPSTVSRMTEDVGKFSLLLAAIHLQVACSNSLVVERADLFAFKRMSYNWLKAELEDA